MTTNRQRSIVGELLDWGVTTLARGISKGVESVLGDARDAIEAKRQKVEAFRENEVDITVEAAPKKDEKPKTKAGA